MSRFVEMWRAEQLKAQIQQRDALMAQLEQDKNQAEESSRLKSRFMATVSHEGLCVITNVMCDLRVRFVCIARQHGAAGTGQESNQLKSRSSESCACACVKCLPRVSQFANFFSHSPHSLKRNPRDAGHDTQHRTRQQTTRIPNFRTIRCRFTATHRERRAGY
jgi:hypothetical protein